MSVKNEGFTLKV